MEYLKLFNNHSEYEKSKASGLTLPIISHCIEEVEIHYSPWTWANEYLTFVALEDGTFKLNNVVSYSLDNGETWTELAANTESPMVTSGSKIMWKGILTPNSTNGIGTFKATSNFNIQGNAMSLLYGDNYKSRTDLIGKN